MPATRSGRPIGLLIAAEGLDGSGKSAGLDGLGRWLERKGRRVHLVRWEPSRLVARASVAPRGRQILTPRVAALLAASEARRTGWPSRSGGRWRGATSSLPIGTPGPPSRARLRAAWSRSGWPRCIGSCRGPILSSSTARSPAAALARALATRPTPVGAEAIASAYAAFLDRLLATYERLLADPAAGPWPVPSVILDPRAAPADRVDAIRERVRPLLDGARAPAAVA